MNCLDLETSEGRSRFMRELVGRDGRVRSDAVLNVDKRRSSVDINHGLVDVFGVIQQKLVNLGDEYEVNYTKIRYGKI